MNEEQRRQWTDPYEMFDTILLDASERKLRLFACACCRSIWHLLTDDACRHAVDVAEAIANGLATAGELAAAYDAGCKTSKAVGATEERLAACAAADSQAWRAAEGAFEHSLKAALYSQEPEFWKKEPIFRAAAYRAEANVICELLRDVFGTPEQPCSLDPSWLTPTVRSLIATIQHGRRFDTMPILGDALEEAGCTSPEILAHCRLRGHVVGCWVLDLLLGSEDGGTERLLDSTALME